MTEQQPTQAAQPTPNWLIALMVAFFLTNFVLVILPIILTLFLLLMSAVVILTG